MKTKKLFFGVTTLVVLVLIAFLIWPHRERERGYLASVGVSVPESAISAFEKGPFMLTGDEYMIAFRLPPSQIPALTKQLQNQERYQTGPYAGNVSSRVIHAPYVAKFFAGVPNGAVGAMFEVIHDKGEKSEWVTECSFAIDKSTGRVWFYGWELYN